MQLRLILPIEDELDPDYQNDVTVQTESDIRMAGFAVARAVRAWLRRMPFVPSTDDLRFTVYAEVEQDTKPAPVPAPAAASPRQKPKRKGKK